MHALTLLEQRLLRLGALALEALVDGDGVDEDGKVGRRHHCLVAQGRAAGVRGAQFKTQFWVMGKLPHPLRVEPLERGQPDAAQVLGLRVWVLVREPPEIRGWGGGRQCVAAGPLAAAFEGGRGGGAHMWDIATALGKEIFT